VQRVIPQYERYYERIVTGAPREEPALVPAV
jgi:hypothetical protein